MIKRKSRLAPTAKRGPSATDLAYKAIKEEILGNRLRSGEPVPTERFVRELKLSRTPVREAILRLEKEGLIEIRPRMGTFVSHLDLRRIHEMYQVRRLLEGHAARLVAENPPVDRLKLLEQELKALTTAGNVNWRIISETGQQVHRLIVDSCENRVLAQMIHSLQDHFQRFRSLSLEIPEKVLASHREHLHIVRALISRDPDAAQRAVHVHFENAGRALLDSLLRNHVGSPGPRVTVGAG